LTGWEEDDHSAALGVFRNTCMDFDEPDWRSLCAIADTAPDARTFFELFFRPVIIGGDQTALFTGYFEPELDGSRTRTARFRFPVYRVPPEVGDGQWLSRAEIETTGILEGRDLEIAWVDDAVELFFLQIQGSGRIRMTDGSVIRVGYGGRNGHEYRSIGQELVRRGIYGAHQVSAPVIANWVRRNPDAGRRLLHHNPSYIFFREVEIDDPELGPLGAMNRSITPMRTIAVDPTYTPLGAPVWIEKGRRGAHTPADDRTGYRRSDPRTPTRRHLLRVRGRCGDSRRHNPRSGPHDRSVAHRARAPGGSGRLRP
jgi:membrane-bound lytic murein transglycosylase A